MPTCLEPACAPQDKSHHEEQAAKCSEQSPLLTATRESPCAATKTHHSQKLNVNLKHRRYMQSSQLPSEIIILQTQLSKIKYLLGIAL